MKIKVQWTLRIPNTQKTGIFGKLNIQIGPDFFLLFSLPLSSLENRTPQKTELFIQSQGGSVFHCIYTVYEQKDQTAKQQLFLFVSTALLNTHINTHVCNESLTDM